VSWYDRSFVVPRPPEAPKREDAPSFENTGQPVEESRPVSLPVVTEQRFGTGDLIESLVSSIDNSFDYIHQASSPPAIEPPALTAAVDPVPEYDSVVPETKETESAQLAVEDNETSLDVVNVRSAHDELQEIFDELKEQTGDLKPLIDFETHYSLGLAYKDMDLLDEAISEFQMAFRTAGADDFEGDCIHCCNIRRLL
jgi:hypothetical protein